MNRLSDLPMQTERVGQDFDCLIVIAEQVSQDDPNTGHNPVHNIH